MWEDEREGPEEVFTLATGILAVDGPTAVVRAEVCYGDPPCQEYRDLWIIRFAEDGHCTWFEEWALLAWGVPTPLATIRSSRLLRRPHLPLPAHDSRPSGPVRFLPEPLSASRFRRAKR